VLPLAFGEAGLPVHPLLREALTAAAWRNAYAPVAGLPELREAAAGYWTRRGLPTPADAVVTGPGSKPLLFALLLALGTDVAVPKPSWVSYAAQAALAGIRPHFVPAPPGEGGICDPAALARAVTTARAAGRRIGLVIATLPDNPPAGSPSPPPSAPCARSRPGTTWSSSPTRSTATSSTAPRRRSSAPPPAPRTVVTTAPSKSLALGGWRAGAARLPDSPAGRALRGRLLGIASEIWPATAAPVQRAAVLAFTEPPELAERIARSRSLHAAVCRAVAARFVGAGLDVRPPQAAFYLYPGFHACRGVLAAHHGVTTGQALARHLLDRYGMGVLPASAFGENATALRLRVATGLLYGDTDAQRELALTSPGPLTLPWIAAALARIGAILADLAPSHHTAQPA